MIDVEPSASISPYWEQTAQRLAQALFVTIVLLYCGLIAVGQWQADEYADFSQLAQGLPAMVHRLAWSPRPLSELLLSGYGWLTIRFQRPLTLLFLGLLWGGFGLATVPAWAMARRRKSYGAEEPWPIALAGFGLMAAFLTSGPLTEVFYWPAGAVAYLPTLSATLFIFLEVARGRLDTSAGRRGCGIALLIAALSSETGAIVAISYALVMTGWTIARRLLKPVETHSLRPLGWHLWPVAVAFMVLMDVRLNRFQAIEPIGRRVSATLGHPAMSALAAIGDVVAGIFGPGRHQRGWFLLNTEFLSVALLAIGIGLCWNRLHSVSERHRGDVVRLALALLLASVMTLTASYVHFGQAVGERHQLMVRCWIRIAMAGIAITLLSTRQLRHLPERRILRVFAPFLMFCGVAVIWHVGPLVKEYQAYGSVYSTIQANFRSGFATGNEQIDWIVPPNRGVITPATIDAGTYHRNSGSDYPEYILKYFNKDMLVVRTFSEQRSPPLP